MKVFGRLRHSKKAKYTEVGKTFNLFTTKDCIKFVDSLNLPILTIPDKKIKINDLYEFRITYDTQTEGGLNCE